VLRLDLLRHAKSSWDDHTLTDRDRPLAPRGRRAATRIARWAQKHDVRPQLVVSSSAVRARETLQGVLPGLGEPEVWIEVALYAASAETLLQRVRALPEEAEEAMLVGHNPGLAHLVLKQRNPASCASVPRRKSQQVRSRRWRRISRAGPSSSRAERAWSPFVVPRELKKRR
jgi:phosphohistidine phosphatase